MDDEDTPHGIEQHLDRREACSTCETIRSEYNGFGPSHEGSRLCQSGSLASGGNREHCTCDACF